MHRDDVVSQARRAAGALLLCALVGAAPGVAAAQPTSGKPVQPIKPTKPAAGTIKLPVIETWQLANGLTVAFLPVHRAPVVSVQVWYHVGSKDEPRDRRGSAHMFEHAMFKGTLHLRPEEHAREINRLGGYVNAGTTQDMTFYHDTLPKEYMAFAVRLEAERMRNLLFRKEMIDTEREVVKEEIRERENSPLARGFVRFLEIAFTAHPYAWEAGGRIDELDKTTPEELQKFYNLYYQPNNALLVVVGDVDLAEVKTAADTYFGPLPRGPEPPRPAKAAPEPPQKEKKREQVGESQVGIIFGGYHIPGAANADIAPLQVLGLILSAGESSRMNKRLVRQDKLALGAGGQALVLEDPGLFLVFAAYLDASKADAVEAALLDEVGKLRASPPTAQEVRKAKNQLLAGFVFGLEGVSGLAQQIGVSWVQTGDPRSFLSEIDRFEAVTPADVQRVAKQYLVDSNLTLVLLPPTGAAGQGGAQ